MHTLALIALSLAPAADPASERLNALILAANDTAKVVKAEPDRRDSSKEVVVSVDAAGWHAKYKGQSTTWPRSTPAAEVAHLAGEWGQGIDTPKVAPEVRPAPTFPGKPVQPGAVRGVQPRLPAVGVNSADAVPLVGGDTSHVCPKCGPSKGEWRTVESFNPDGTHNHRCLNCGNVFTH